MLAVVQLAHHDGAVDVAIHKVHQHLRAGARGRHRLEMVAVTALLNVGGAQDLGGLGTQVVGGLVGHAQHHKTVGV